MASLQDRLNEAETALHNLTIGRSVVEVHDANGEVIRYLPASRPSLLAYIADLKRQLGGATPGPMWLVTG